MTRRPESRAVLLGAVEATAAALCARLKVEADCGTTRANLRELLARGGFSRWGRTHRFHNRRAQARGTPTHPDVCIMHGD